MKRTCSPSMNNSPPESIGIGRPLLALLLVSTLTGCGLFKPKQLYVESGEAPVLEVPSDLDRPSSDPSLSVPPTDSDRLLSGSELAPPPLGASGPAQGGELYAPASGKTDLLLPNTTDESWDLVGAAIENSQIFRVVEKDKDQLRYRLAIPQPTAVDRRSIWRRMLGIGDAPTQAVDPEVIVLLTGVAQGTEISVIDDADRRLRDGRAARVIAALDLRLKSISTRSSGG